MCRFQTDMPGPACRNQYFFELSKLHPNNIKQIVTEFNRRRNLVALGMERKGMPGPQYRASNMVELMWDNELASSARVWGQQCKQYMHDSCRNTGRFHVSQVVTIREVSDRFDWQPDLYTLINRMWNQKKYFNRDGVRKFQKPHYMLMMNKTVAVTIDTRDYTNVVWATTVFIGCSHAVYGSQKNKMGITEVLICNFGPGGNVLHEPVYLTGPPQSECPQGTKPSSAYQGLCHTHINESSALAFEDVISQRHADQEEMHDSAKHFIPNFMVVLSAFSLQYKIIFRASAVP